MAVTEPAWEDRLEALWSSFDDRSESDFLEAINSLVAELPDNDAVGIFERAAVLDSTAIPTSPCRSISKRSN